MTVIMDTTVLIDVLRGNLDALNYLQGLLTVPVCSEVTRAEILRGLRSGEHATTERLFDSVRWVPVDEAIARRAGEMARRWDRHRPAISLVDLVIAATAEQLGAELATANVRHFPMFPALRPPYAST